MNGDPLVLPEWLLYLAGAFGTFMAALVARLGWKSGSEEKRAVRPGSHDMKIEAAALDSSSAIMLAAAIEAATKAALKMATEAQEAKDRDAREYRTLASALNSMTKAILKMIESRQEEMEERREKEQRDIERENERLEREVAELKRQATLSGTHR